MRYLPRGGNSGDYDFTTKRDAKRVHTAKSREEQKILFFITFITYKTVKIVQKGNINIYAFLSRDVFKYHKSVSAMHLCNLQYEKNATLFLYIREWNTYI